MSEIMGTKVVPAAAEKRETVVVSFACDLCGKAGQEASISDGVNWLHDTSHWRTDFDETIVRRKQGYTSSEGGEYETTEYHVCPACWEAKLATLFAGAKATVKTVDW